MAGVISSTLKNNALEVWYIELQDAAESANTQICYDIEEYAQKIEIMGEVYGGAVEVFWSADANVTPAQINEVRQQIMAYEAAREAEQENPTHLVDGTQTFRAENAKISQRTLWFGDPLFLLCQIFYPFWAPFALFCARLSA